MKDKNLFNFEEDSKYEFSSLALPIVFISTITILFYPIVYTYFSYSNDTTTFVGLLIKNIFLLSILVGSMFNYLLLAYMGRIRNVFIPILSAISLILIVQVIEASEKVNIENFHFFEQDFSYYLTDALPIFSQLFLLVLLTFVGSKVGKKIIPKKSAFTNLILTNVFFALFSNLNWFRELFWNKLFSLEAISQSGNIWNVILISIIAYLLIFVIVKSWNMLLHNCSSVTLTLFSSFVLAIICNYYLQFGIRKEEMLLNRYIFPGAIWFQIIILTIVFFIIYLIINRYLLATICLSLLVYILTIANSLKFELRNEPLLYSDLTWLKDIQLVLSFVDSKYVGQLLLYVAIAVLCIILFMRKYQNKKIIHQPLKRLIVLMAPVSLFAFVLNVFEGEKDQKIVSDIPIISELNNNFEIGWLSFAENARYKSVAYVWIKQLTKPLIDKPREYSQSSIENLVNKYKSEAERINSERTENIEDETIIFVLSESLADPSRLPRINITQDVLPNIHKLMSQNTSGTMISDGYGGGTANMEFQALTGLAYRSFSDSVSIAYTEIVPNLSYFPSISNQFSSENRFVIHPANSTNYNRKNIYSTLNFEKFISHFNTDETMQSVEVVGANISDRTAYLNVLNRIDAQSSQFFSVITMQNHIPHKLDSPESIQATGENFTEEENASLTSYSRLLSVTDSETKEFLDRLSEFDKKITVVFYGDHLPGIYPDSVFKENPELQYMTDFFIWSNYQTKKTEIKRVYSSDFLATLLEHTNAKVTPYQALLTRVAEESNLSIEDGEAFENLKMIEYDLTEGKNYLQNSLNFFE
ncbi:LTA synthase family protein [Streptococcus suis]|uniref:LTA synthase family protein n=1 Tax=Streptococcus suis TaxID=1307 RepID=UPI000C18E8B0|nr:LTA synthase family protein [Streptococcus suis]